MTPLPRGLRVAAALAAMGLALSACGTFSRGGGGVSGAKIVSSAAISRVNAFRAQNGAPPLAVDANASRAALAQAKNMASHQLMEHNIGFGANFARRMKHDDVPLPAAENIAEGQQSVDGAITAWENSPPHRRNMLGAAYKGVGVAVATSKVDGHPYWAMVLTGK